MQSKAMIDFMYHATQAGMTPQEIEYWLFSFVKVTLPIVIIFGLIYLFTMERFDNLNN